MNDIVNSTNIYPTSQGPPAKGGEIQNANFNLEAHTSSNMKLERPKVNVAIAPPLIQTKRLFKPEEAEKNLRQINTDIYEGTQKEKNHHDFNFKRYFTIFGILGILTAAIAYFGKK